MTPLVRQRYRDFVLGRIPAPVFSLPHFVAGLISLVSVILIPLGIWHMYRAFRPRRRVPPDVQEELNFAERAELGFAFPIMVHSAIRQPGDAQVPGLFLLTFDPALAHRREEIADVALAVLAPSPEQLPAADVAYLEGLMADEEYQRYRRRPLPASATKGMPFAAIDLALSPYYLPERHLGRDLPFVPVLAVPGEQGWVRQMPYWLVFDGPAPPWAAACPVMIA